MTYLIDPLLRSLAPRRAAVPGAPGGDAPVTVIADTSTPVPGGSGTFDFLTFPQISAGTVAFIGAGKGQTQNLYASFGGLLTLALPVGASIPSTGGKFLGFSLPAPAKQALAFSGSGSLGTDGVYVKSGEILRMIADSNTPIPKGSGNFTTLNYVDFDLGGAISFVGNGSGGATGVYLSAFPNPQPIQRIADTSTPIPGGGGNFDYFYSPSVTESGVAFFASREGNPAVGAGIYVGQGGPLRTVANLQTPVPGMGGTFSAFGSPAMSGNSVAFHAHGTAGSDGVYLQSGTGPVTVVADLNTPVPGGSGTFQTFFLSDPSLDGGDVAFLAGYANTEFGIFARVNGSLVRVITTEQTIGGKGIITLGIGVNQLSQGTVTFYAVTGPGVFGLYTLPVG